MFVENAALEAMISEMIRGPWQLPVPRGAPGERACPVCGEASVVTELDGSEVDRCAAHGVWFDAGELANLLAREAGVDPDEPRRRPGLLRRLFGGRPES